MKENKIIRDAERYVNEYDNAIYTSYIYLFEDFISDISLIGSAIC